MKSRCIASAYWVTPLLLLLTLTAADRRMVSAQEVAEEQADVQEAIAEESEDDIAEEAADEADVKEAETEKTAPDTSSAAEETLKERPAEPVDPEIIQLHLMDGSTISGKLSVERIDIETEFGPLSVPVTSIRSFVPGLGSHPEVAENIGHLVEDLGSSNFGKREAAQRELLKLGPSVRMELERRLNDPDTERRARIEIILGEFDQASDDQDADEDDAGGDSRMLVHQDTVETTSFTILGKIVPQSFNITSRYGPLTVPLKDVRRAQRGTVTRDVRDTLRVDSQNLVQRAFKKSDVRVERGDRVTVTATGTLQMTPWGNRMISTPDGGANFGWYVPNEIPGGALVAQIGGSGNVFKVGSKLTFTASRSGTLQFAIAMTPDQSNNHFPGEYSLKIAVQKK